MIALLPFSILGLEHVDRVERVQRGRRTGAHAQVSVDEAGPERVSGRGSRNKAVCRRGIVCNRSGLVALWMADQWGAARSRIPNRIGGHDSQKSARCTGPG